MQPDSCGKVTGKKRGLLIVYTGNGKGKTTAALGCAFRALGHGCSVCMIQFIKGPMESGEVQAADKFGDHMHIYPMGNGFIWNERDIERNREVALKAWNFAKEVLRSPSCDLIILDELTYLIKFGLLDEGEVVESLRSKPPELHVIVTGRDAPPVLIECADLVTDMHNIKHPLDAGIKAQRGIDF